jgi:hypothetical protein
MRPVIGVGTALCILSTSAVAAPAALLNKTVRLSWTTTAQGTISGDSTPHPMTRSNSQTIYISGAGRIFSRRTLVDGGKSSATRQSAPGESNYHFEGNKLVGTSLRGGGAVQMTVTFDSIGQSCELSFISGKQSGQAYLVKDNNGQTYTVVGSPAHSNANCSITGGNPFAE